MPNAVLGKETESKVEYCYQTRTSRRLAAHEVTSRPLHLTVTDSPGSSGSRALGEGKPSLQTGGLADSPSALQAPGWAGQSLTLRVDIVKLSGSSRFRTACHSGKRSQ